MARQERPMILAFTLLLVSFSSAEWSQDRMVVSFWVDPVVPVDEFPDRYAEIRQANFSVLLGGFGARTATQVSAQVEASTSAGMPSIVPISCDGCEIAAKNAWGFQIKDEPPASDFEQLANETMALRARNPDKLMFINLLPNYATPAQFGADTYGEYVSQFVATVRPQVLCTDHYPSFEPSQQQGNKTMAGYRANLEVLRDASKAAGIPFWNFFNTMPYGTMRDPTEEQLSWQVFTSLAYGAKGVLYFCYWTPTGSTFARGGAIMTPQGSSAAFVPGPHYAHARRINSVVAAWASVLFPATSDRVSLVDVSHPPSSLTTGPLADIGETPWAKSVWTESYLVGEFTLSDGTPATLIVNQLPSESLWPTITPRHNATVYEVDRSTGTVAPAVDDSPLMSLTPTQPGLQLLFAPGAARLLVFPA